MYIILHKKRLNTDNILNDIYDVKIKKEIKDIELGNEDNFSKSYETKEYYAKKLAMTAAYSRAKEEIIKYKKKYKKYLSKKLTIDIMMIENKNLIGILIRNKKTLVAVLDNWEVINNEK